MLKRVLANQAVNRNQKRIAFGSLRWRSGAGYLSYMDSTCFCCSNRPTEWRI